METKEAFVALPERRFDDEAMQRYCDARGATLLRVLQEARGGESACSGVLLALDHDGIVKVFKEELPHKDSALCECESESTVHARLAGIAGMPVQHGTECFDGITVLRQSVAYGQSLQDWRDGCARLTDAQVESVIGRTAAVLAEMHARGVAHLDIRPQNVKIDGLELSLIDVGDGRYIGANCQVQATVSDPAFAPPETASRGVASAASDVYQLGAMGRALLTVTNRKAEHQDSFLRACLAYMIHDEPLFRPSAAKVVEFLGAKAVRLPAISFGTRRTSPQAGTVLFPARMGIPHRGHIDFIARVMGLGFPVVISLSRSYTITERDPLPKWQVMKMVAASLVDKGFVPNEDFRFIFTPLFDNAQAQQMHFAMMPEREKVFAVASSNPGVHDLFPDLPFIDQRAVFGREGETYRDRSWGESLRIAVVDDDKPAFDRLAASGVERIMTFEEMRRDYAACPVEFVSGKVNVTVRDEEGNELKKGRCFQYFSPQEVAVLHLAGAGYDVRLEDLYARDTKIVLSGRPRALRDAGTTFDENGDLTIAFVLI